MDYEIEERSNDIDPIFNDILDNWPNLEWHQVTRKNFLDVIKPSKRYMYAYSLRPKVRDVSTFPGDGFIYEYNSNIFDDNHVMIVSEVCKDIGE